MKKQPKSIKSVRKIRKRQPKLIEGPKKTLLIKGNKTSEIVQKFLKNIRSLRRQRAVFYSRKHEVHPFEGKEQIQKYCQKADTSLFIFGSNSKKRPNNIVIGRTYDWKILDMVELGITSLTAIQDISNATDIPYQIKPFVIFQGDLWETDQQCGKIRNLLTDFFFENNKVEGIQIDKLFEIIICFTILENKKIFMRVYQNKVEGKDILQDQGKMVIEQLGPNAELVIRRTSFADSELWKKATYIPKPKKKKQNKNVKYDEIGNKRGKLYVDRQDLKRVNTKKRKLISKDKNGKGAKKQGLSQKVQNQFAAN